LAAWVDLGQVRRLLLAPFQIDNGSPLATPEPASATLGALIGMFPATRGIKTVRQAARRTDS